MNNQEKIWDKEYSLHANKWHKDTQTLPKILKGKNILELGLGNGKTLRSIIKQHPKSVTAIDFSKKAISLYKDDFKDSKIKFLKANIKSLPFKDKQFNVVVCYYILNNLLEKERERATREISRVLISGGKVIFEDFAVGDFREKNHKKILENHTIEKKNGLYCHFFSLQELKNLFKNFSKISLKIITSTPIKSKNSLKRKIISGIIKN